MANKAVSKLLPTDILTFENDSVERIVVPGMGKRAPIVLGKKDFGEISPEEMGAVIGLPNRSVVQKS